jgi:hypothetical protein
MRGKLPAIGMVSAYTTFISESYGGSGSETSTRSHPESAHALQGGAIDLAGSNSSSAR